eukprot:gene30632-39905_t
MSYMEMKERLKNEKLKRAQIDNDKQRRQLDLERRQASTLRARQVKAEANSTVREREMDRFETAMKEFDNKLTLERKEKHFRDAALKEKHEQFKYEKKKQHESTKTVLLEHNPYAQKISQESLTK